MENCGLTIRPRSSPDYSLGTCKFRGDLILEMQVGSDIFHTMIECVISTTRKVKKLKLCAEAVQTLLCKDSHHSSPLPSFTAPWWMRMELPWLVHCWAGTLYLDFNDGRNLSVPQFSFTVVSPTMWKSEIREDGIFGSQTHHVIVLSLIFVYLINFLLELIYMIKISIHKHICFPPIGFAYLVS